VLLFAGAKMNTYFRWILALIITTVLMLGGYVVATGFLQHPPGQNPTESAMAIAFWPTLILQIMLGISAVTTVPDVILQDPKLVDKPFAFGLFFGWRLMAARMMPFLVIILIIRLALIAGTVYDLTAFQGRYLDLLINGVVPDTSLAVAALLLAFTIAATLLLPTVSLGLAAAISIFVQQRTGVRAHRYVLVAVDIALIVLVTLGVTQLTNSELRQASGFSSWLDMAAFGAFGDWGLTLLHLGFYGAIWATIPYGIFLGLALLVIAFGEIGLIKWLLAQLTRQAERNRDLPAEGAEKIT
jgi:hypothetical protein